MSVYPAESWSEVSAKAFVWLLWGLMKERLMGRHKVIVSLPSELLVYYYFEKKIQWNPAITSACVMAVTAGRNEGPIGIMYYNLPYYATCYSGYPLLMTVWGNLVHRSEHGSMTFPWVRIIESSIETLSCFWCCTCVRYFAGSWQSSRETWSCCRLSNSSKRMSCCLTMYCFTGWKYFGLMVNAFGGKIWEIYNCGSDLYSTVHVFGMEWSRCKKRQEKLASSRLLCVLKHF